MTLAWLNFILTRLTFVITFGQYSDSQFLVVPLLPWRGIESNFTLKLLEGSASVKHSRPFAKGRENSFSLTTPG